MLNAVRLSINLLARREKSIYYFLVLIRVVVSFLDLIAVATIGLVAAVLASGLSSQNRVKFLGFDFETNNQNLVLWLAITALLFFLVKAILSAIFSRVSAMFLAGVEHKIASEVIRYIFSGDLARVKSLSKGDIVWAGTNSAHIAVTGILAAAASLVSESALFATMFFLFFIVNPVLALSMAFYFLIVVAVFQLFVTRRLKLLGGAMADSTSRATNSLLDLLIAFREIRVFRAEDHFLRRFDSPRKDLANQWAMESFLHSLPRLFVETALILGVLVLVARQVISGDLQDGLVTTSVFLAGGVKMMAALLPLQNAYANIRVFAPQAAASERLLRIARTTTSELSPNIPQETGRDEGMLGVAVSVREATFTHHDGDRPVVSRVSLEIKPGSFTALIGPSGSGKSTLVDLILGLHRPEAGHVSLDGIPATKFLASNPSRIAYVPQQPGVTEGTLAENIAFGEYAGEVSEDLVWRALELASLSEFVRELPDGIHTSLGAQVDGLSGGQRQRLGLARALYRRPRLLVLDEATSALDATLEASVADRIRNLVPETTVLVIAHRLVTLQKADQIFVIDDGKVVAQGTFSSLRKLGGVIDDYIRLMSVSEDD